MWRTRMNKNVIWSRFATIAGAALALSGLLLVGACSGEDVGSGAAPLTVQCVDSSGSAPAGAWICGEARTVECDSLV